MTRRLVIAAHWTDDDDGLDKLVDACAPLKAEGTTGIAAVVEGEDAKDLYEILATWPMEGS